jgi:hypothetical protein
MSMERSIHFRRRIAVAPFRLHRQAAIALLGLLTAAALTIVARRLAGALETPLEPAVLAVAGGLIAATAFAVRLGWFFSAIQKTSPKKTLPWADEMVMTITSAAAFGLGIGLSLPGTSPIGVFILCMAVGIEESWAWVWFVRRHVGAASRHMVAETLPLHLPPSSVDTTDVPPNDVTQQLVRSRTANGEELLSGWLRVELVAGQRTASVHVAFCPAFAVVPKLEFEQTDGPECRIKTAQLLPYGARLDLKLTAAAQEQVSVLLQFSATSADQNRYSTPRLPP